MVATQKLVGHRDQLARGTTSSWSCAPVVAYRRSPGVVFEQPLVVRLPQDVIHAEAENAWDAMPPVERLRAGSGLQMDLGPMSSIRLVEV